MYKLHLLRDVPGMRSGNVTTAQPGVHVIPAERDVLLRIPARYRAAFKRANNAWWRSKHDASDNPLLYLELRNSRGKYLNTLYAIPVK